MRTRLPHLLALAIALAGLARPLAAQTLAGLVKLAPSGVAAPQTLVLAVGEGSRIVGAARTDATGVFALQVGEPVEFRLVFVRAHAAPVVTPALALDSAAYVERQFDIPGDTARADSLFFAGEVTTPAAARPGGPAPAYPDRQARTGVRGRVRMVAIVDAEGRVDERTIEVLGTTGEEFVKPVRESLRRSRFAPARRGERAVAQLVQVTYDFGCPGDLIDGDVIVRSMYPGCKPR